MNPRAKTVVLLFVMGFVAPAWAAPVKTYIKETAHIRNNGQTFQAIAPRTLVEGGNTARYSIQNLFDHNKKTAWVTKFDENNYFNDVATFEIDFKKPVYVKSITFQNGYQKKAALFYANQRIKEIEVRRIVTKAQAEVEADLTLKDTMAVQRIPALKMWSQSANFFKTRKLLFFVVGVYPGRGGPRCLDREWTWISVFHHDGRSLLERRHEKKAA